MQAKVRIDVDVVQRAVVRIHGQNVMLDSDLASLYQVDVKVLNQAVKRNRQRFPPDFMFQLTSREATSLRSQFVTAKTGRGGRRTLPYAFTETRRGDAVVHFAKRAGRSREHYNHAAFVQLRRILGSSEELTRKLAALERKYDGQFHVVFEAIRRLMEPPRPPRRVIGFGRAAGR